MSILKYKDPKTGEFKRINPYKADLSFVGKDGVVVNKAANSEIVEISGKGCVQKSITAFGIVYGKDYAGNETTIAYSDNESNSTIAKRQSNGELLAIVSDTPTDNTLTNKKYVADNYVEKVKFTNLEQALNGYILDTTKEAYVDLDSAVLKDSVAVGDNVYPIADKTRALVTRIEGKTTKMVQLLDKSTFPATHTMNGVTFTNNGDGTITVNGTVTEDNHAFTQIQAGIECIANHKYLIMGCPEGGIAGKSYGISIQSPGNPIVWDEGKGNIFSFDSHTTITLYLDFYTNNATYTNKVVTPQLFDLTAMNRENITTVEQFKAEFPDIYPYENGNIYPAKISGVKFYEKQDKSGEQASVTLPETYDLHGIGDYKDYLEITKNEDNELYTLKKVQVIEKVILNGTENWTPYPYGDKPFTNVGYSIPLNPKFIKWTYRGTMMNLLNKLPTVIIDRKGYGAGDESATLYVRLPNIATAGDMKAHVLSMYEAGTPYIFYGAIATPVETVITTNLTYEQVTAIRHNNGLIEVEGNVNKGYARPTIKNTIVYRLTATNTAEG